jgi:hypothetical protein
MKRKSIERTPRNYDGTAGTSKQMSQLLPEILEKMGSRFKDRPDLIIAYWPELIGSRLSGMTEAVSFIEGVLTVKVKNSSLYSVLTTHEKPRLIKALQARFPSTSIRNILFRIG